MLTFDFVQFVYDGTLNASSNGLFNRLKMKIFYRLFNLISTFGDPLIKSDIGGVPLLLTFSHKLPIILKNYPHYSSNVARIAKYVNHKYDKFTFIDIGANIGDSIAILRKEAEFPILCIEGDANFFVILESNVSLFTDVSIIKAYIGEVSENIGAIASNYGGTGHISKNAIAQDILQIKRLSDVLEHQPSFLHSKMIKIDTDGFDGKILRGATDFLLAAKPVIFFEYDPFFLSQQEDDGISIFIHLSTLGYNQLLLYDNVGDLMFSTDLTNLRIIEEIHLYFSGRQGQKYCDICVFHREDNDLFENARQLEIEFFKQLR